MKKFKHYAILSGGDWTDASVDHLLIPETMDLKKEKKEWTLWYMDVYLPIDKKVEYIDFTDWLIKRGAKPDKEIIEYWDE